MNINNLIVPVGLAALGVFFIALEAFIPSAGVLGVMAAVALISAICSAFWFGGLTFGTIFMAITLVGVIWMVQYLIKKWPSTPLGKMILVEPPPAEELLPDRSELHNLVGRVGKALSLMLPSGFIEIDGKKFDASSGAGTVEEGTWIEVISVRNGTNLIVRPIDQETAMRAEKEKARAEDPLATPIEEVVPDPFADSTSQPET